MWTVHHIDHEMHLNNPKLVGFSYILSRLITLDIFLINILDAELHKRRKPCLEMFWRAQKKRNTNLYSDQPGSDSGTEVGNAVIT